MQKLNLRKLDDLVAEKIEIPVDAQIWEMVKKDHQVHWKYPMQVFKYLWLFSADLKSLGSIGIQDHQTKLNKSQTLSKLNTT